MRYALFSRFDECRVEAHGLYTMVQEEQALGMARMVRGPTVLDICAGIGSMSIAFARTGKRVTSIEIDPRRVAMARHNAQVYGVEELIDFRSEDITAESTYHSLPASISTVFMDPPWGTGRGEYLKHPRLYLDDLRLAGMDLRDIIRRIDCEQVLMRLPPNFDFGIFDAARGPKIALRSRNGNLHYYILRTSREDFLAVPDRSS